MWKTLVSLWPATTVWGGGGEGALFTDLKNNRFQKKLIVQNTIYEYSPLQLSTLATLL